jgi:hypothetical protein
MIGLLSFSVCNPGNTPLKEGKPIIFRPIFFPHYHHVVGSTVHDNDMLFHTDALPRKKI